MRSKIRLIVLTLAVMLALGGCGTAVETPTTLPPAAPPIQPAVTSELPVTSEVVVTTLAGSGQWGHADGPAAEAQFESPWDITVDAAGNVYVADADDGRIRLITPDGNVATFAGSGLTGYTDGPAAEAEFNKVASLVLDGAGNAFVVDTNNHSIRVVTPDGVVNTLAGGMPGYADGSGTDAEFYYPLDVILGADGNLYVTDALNNRIRKITPDGMVTTFAGSGERGLVDGPALEAQFYAPCGLAMDAAGNIYVTESFPFEMPGNNCIRKITPDGEVSTLAGTGQMGYTDGPGATAQFWSPAGVAVDAAGNVYIADYYNNVIRAITPDGVVSTLAGTGQMGYTDGPGDQAQFNRPWGVALDEQGNLYVADSGNSVIRKISLPSK